MIQRTHENHHRGWNGELYVGSRWVFCTKCGERVDLRGEAWFDPYSGHTWEGMDGSHVHYACLSQERLAEINESNWQEEEA